MLELGLGVWCDGSGMRRSPGGRNGAIGLVRVLGMNCLFTLHNSQQPGPQIPKPIHSLGNDNQPGVGNQPVLGDSRMKEATS